MSPAKKTPYASLLSQLEGGRARVVVAGLGYVGLPLALLAAESGMEVAGLDPSQEKVAGVNAGKSHVEGISGHRVAEAVGSGRLEATSDSAVLARADVIVIAVPTPLSPEKAPDLTAVRSVCRSVAAR